MSWGYWDESRPRKTKSKKKNAPSISHRSLNSLTAYDFSKLTQLKPYNWTNRHDFICISETWLDSATPSSLLEIEGYNLIRADHSNNIKSGGVYIYDKKSLSVWAISLPYLNRALLLEMSYSNKKVIVSVIYRSSSRNNNEFQLFLLNFEQLLNDVNKRKLFLSVITDFNARCFCQHFNFPVRS